VLAVLGPTASGKSALGMALAERIGGEILNCDSTAVYRGFDIGTDKVPPAEQRGIPHHLIDIADPTEVYTAAHSPTTPTGHSGGPGRGHVPILVGGTGFYYRALIRGLFPGPGADVALRASSIESRSERDQNGSIVFCAEWIPNPQTESARATRNVSCARSRSISRPDGR
jgi:tRNA dimethylallyltransferase